MAFWPVVILVENEGQYCQICNPVNPGSNIGPSLEDKVAHYNNLHGYTKPPTDLPTLPSEPKRVRLVHPTVNEN